MKIVLTHSYFLEEDEIEKQIMKPYPPLGLLYLYAYLKKQKINVEVYDTTFSTYDNLIQYLDSQKPEMLGIYCNMLTKHSVLKLINYCNEKNIISILGGPDAATQVNEFLDYGANIIIEGEGEETLNTVIKAIQKKNKYDLLDIPNVSFKDENGNVISNPSVKSRRHLDEFPFPARDAIDFEKYLTVWEEYHGQRAVSLITARGCAFTCKWCSHSVYGHTHRRRTPQNVVDEIKQIIKEYKPTHLWYADDVFTVNKNWLRKFNDLLKRENIYLPFYCITRADRFDEETANMLKEMGCYQVWIGAESGSQKILDAMSRGVKKEQVSNAINLCKKYGIESGMFVMFGYPGETIQDINESIDFIRDLHPDIYLTTVAYPLRGTQLYEEIKTDIITDSDWVDQVQNELDIKYRFTKPLYDFAIKKMASEYRKQKLPLSPKWIYHAARSMYCGYKMNQLSNTFT